MRAVWERTSGYQQSAALTYKGKKKGRRKEISDAGKVLQKELISF